MTAIIFANRRKMTKSTDTAHLRSILIFIVLLLTSYRCIVATTVSSDSSAASSSSSSSFVDPNNSRQDEYYYDSSCINSNDDNSASSSCEQKQTKNNNEKYSSSSVNNDVNEKNNADDDDDTTSTIHVEEINFNKYDDVITNDNNDDSRNEETYEHSSSNSNDDHVAPEKKKCEDSNDECYGWASAGECDANPNYMLVNCRKSCGVCTLEELDLGLTQENGNNKPEILETIQLSHDYILNKVQKDRQLRTIVTLCKNEHELCSFWASLGECDANPNYMKKSCSLACRSCDQHLLSSRCPVDPNATRALEPGDLNKMFERITDVSEGSEYAKYEPVVHSRPDRLAVDEGKEDNELDYKIGPWVVTFESFLTDEECDRLVEMGAKMGYARSTGVGKMKADGLNEHIVVTGRTSENAWCAKECNEDPLVSNVKKRIANVTGIPENNQEPLQLLKYEVGQFYNVHKDYIDYHVDRQVGPRVLTFFLYLSDVEEGGGTKFHHLDIISEPKKGKALLWPNVLDSDPMALEPKSYHEALPVVKGLKYGANSWIHLFDWEGPVSRQCI